MCTILLLLRPGESWPLLLAANRDERLDRAFDAPGRWWEDAPGVVAWRDRTSGGSWLGSNDDGVTATLVNAVNELGPLANKASRGELVLRALRHGDADAAARDIAALEPRRYGGFTLLVADRGHAYAIANGGGVMRVDALAPGHHLLSPEGCDRPGTPRFDVYFAEFRRLAAPDPERGDWDAWIALLQREDRDDPHHAMTVTAAGGFGTVASTLLAVPAAAGPPRIRFADGPPTRTAYRDLLLPVS